MKVKPYPALPVFLVVLVLTALLFEFHQQRKHQRRLELLAIHTSRYSGLEREALPFTASLPAPSQAAVPSVPVVVRESEHSLMININTATSLELQQLPGIGPARAQAIIEYRQTYGEFKTIEELMNVSGIGEITLQRIKNRLEL